MLLRRNHLLHLIADGDTLFVSYTAIAATVPSVAEGRRRVAALTNDTLYVFCCVIILDVLRLICFSLLGLEDLRLLYLHRAIHRRLRMLNLLRVV